jgi:hypothetical protein
VRKILGKMQARTIQTRFSPISRVMLTRVLSPGLLYWNGVDGGPDLFDANAFGYTQIAGVLLGNSCAGCNTITFAFRDDTSYRGIDSVFVGTPERASLPLIGTGALGIAGVIRRKINL